MLGKTYDGQVCSAARALEVVGERWSLLILRDAMYAGATRFADFQRLGVATNVLAKRLDGLVKNGILERRAGGYAVTEKGFDLAPAIIALSQWGDRWAAPDGPPILYRHRCAAPVVEQTVCARCGNVDDLADIHVVPGPGMPAELVDR